MAMLDTAGPIATCEVASPGDRETPGRPRIPRPESVCGPSLNRLRCFEAVVEEAGFKRATARLHITQPALSYQIKQLEEELGVQLFYRRPGGVCPTEVGRLLFQHAQRVSAAVRQAQRAIKELSEGTAGEIRVGTVNSIGIHFLPQVLWALRERHPATRPTVLYRDSGDIVDTLLSSQLDLAVLALPRVDPRLRYEILFEERISLVSGRTHPFFGRPTVTARQLAGQHLVELSAQTPTGALVRDYLERAGVAVDPVISTLNVETVKHMVEIGMGLALLPDMVTERDSAAGGRLWRSVIDPPLTRRVALVTWGDAPVSRAVAAFIDEVRRRSSAWPGSKVKVKT